MLDRRLLDGSVNAPPELMTLYAGLLRLSFDGCGLRYVRLGDRELVRRIYFAVRDANWDTVPDKITSVITDVKPDSFRVEFDVENRQAEIDFRWHGTIAGSADGRVVFEAAGVANTSFRRNRIGFCVLHPLECAGLPVEIRQEGGTTRQTEFPRYIANANPFLNVIGMQHAARPGVTVDLTFEGDVFETEDQRNWIDASYKTFCTPLSRPFPVEVAAGEKVFQRITIELKGRVPQAIAKHPATRGVTLELAANPAGPLPRLGFAIASEGNPPSRKQIERIRLLNPAHLRCEVRLGARDIQAQLAQAAALVAQLGTGTELELVVFANPQDERTLAQLAEVIARQNSPIARWIVFPASGWSTTRELAQAAGQAIRKRIPDAIVGSGTPANFRELNAAPPPTEDLDFVTWSLNPQVHASDNASIVETLAAHDATIESGRRLCDNLPVAIGPVAFKMQVNPYATGPWPPPPPPGQLPPQVDVRQMSLLGAGWTVGSIKHLAECGVHAATYFETIGWKGLMEREAGSPLPEQFPAQPGSVFPLYHVFADLAEFANASVVPVRSSNPLCVDALAVTQIGQTRILIANFTNRTQTATLPVTSTSARIQLLDERSVLTATDSPEAFRGSGGDPIAPTDERLTVNLLPFAVARIDLE